MQHFFSTLAFAGLAFASVSLNAFATPPKEPISHTKKLIEYGWDVPNTRALQGDLSKYERNPFSGVVFRLVEGDGNVFMKTKLDPERMQAEINSIKSLPWQKFTDNFIILYAKTDLDWFDDAEWAGALEHVRYVARAAKAAGCKGIVFDPEPYGSSPWHYKVLKRKDEFTLPEVEAVMRKRGAEFMAAIAAEFDTAKVLCLFGHSFACEVNAVEPEARKGMLTRTYIGALYLDFLNGMLEAAPSGVKLIDGFEHSYHARTETHFQRNYYWVKQVAKNFVPEQLHEKYDRQVQAAHGVYIDDLLNLREKDDPTTSLKWRPSRELLNETENAIFHALRASDEYVWVYSEKMNWWTGKDLPDGLRDTLQRATDRNRESLALLPHRRPR